MTNVDKIKKCLRIVTTAFDDEVTDIMSACVADLKQSGIVATCVTTDTTDPLVLAAMISFAKWRFGNNDQAEVYHGVYDLQKAQLMVDTDYIGD